MTKQTAPQLSIHKTIESQALYYGAVIFFATAITSLVLFWNQAVPIFGKGSIASLSSVFIFLVTFLAFMIAYPRFNSHREHIREPFATTRKWLKRSALALAHASIFFLLSAVTFYIIQDAFKGLLLDQWSSTAMVATASGLTGYWAYLMGARATTMGLSMVLAIFLVGGVLASILSTANPQWWTIHLSALGMGDSLSSQVFNVTLIIGGVVIVALTDAIASDFAQLQSKPKSIYLRENVRMIRAMLATIGILLAFVGLLPWDLYPNLHTISATGMIIVFLIFVCMLPKLAPDFPKAFRLFSFSLLGAVLGCYWLWAVVGYLNLTALEILCAGMVFSWLIVFVRQVSAGLEDSENL